MNKVMVAAIMRDEANNIEDWYISVQHADRIVVVDTGSSDRSVELAKYYESIHPDFTVIEMLPKDFEGPVLFQSSSQNIDRIVSFYRAATRQAPHLSFLNSCSQRMRRSSPSSLEHRNFRSS